MTDGSPRGGNYGGSGGKRRSGGGFAALNAMRAPFQRRGRKCPLFDIPPEDFNYKNVKLLSGFTSAGGRILSRRVTGLCCKHQKRVASYIKRARIMAIMPFCC